ncbi:hypothetical protein M0813_02876 [Anaeramoeba flamelloides]|uniref:Uncharacterized protein n=1 Tax=Anaeramoeba flamelloides TaxID=1746091 RepID=A0ABQ8YEK4_9EUKA|nr:hypothetical protein M0813_02876 [Anaeramoeba flamelloides]
MSKDKSYSHLVQCFPLQNPNQISSEEDLEIMDLINNYDKEIRKDNRFRFNRKEKHQPKKRQVPKEKNIFECGKNNDTIYRIIENRNKNGRGFFHKIRFSKKINLQKIIKQKNNHQKQLNNDDQKIYNKQNFIHNNQMVDKKANFQKDNQKIARSEMNHKIFFRPNSSVERKILNYQQQFNLKKKMKYQERNLENQEEEIKQKLKKYKANSHNLGNKELLYRNPFKTNFENERAKHNHQIQKKEKKRIKKIENNLTNNPKGIQKRTQIDFQFHRNIGNTNKYFYNQDSENKIQNLIKRQNSNQDFHEKIRKRKKDFQRIKFQNYPKQKKLTQIQPIENGYQINDQNGFIPIKPIPKNFKKQKLLNKAPKEKKIVFNFQPKQKGYY